MKTPKKIYCITLMRYCQNHLCRATLQCQIRLERKAEKEKKMERFYEERK